MHSSASFVLHSVTIPRSRLFLVLTHHHLTDREWSRMASTTRPHWTWINWSLSVVQTWCYRDKSGIIMHSNAWLLSLTHFIFATGGCPVGFSVNESVVGIQMECHRLSIHAIFRQDSKPFGGQLLACRESMILFLKAVSLNGTCLMISSTHNPLWFVGI